MSNSSKLFTTAEMILEQAKQYYTQSKGIPFDTIAEKLQLYREATFQFIKHQYDKNNEKLIRIVELGGGSGKVADIILQNAEKLHINYSYSIVDINSQPYQNLLQKYPKLTVITTTFEDFSLNYSDEIDILIGNEVLDMWAGKHVFTDLESEKDQNIAWKLHSINNHQYWIKEPIVPEPEDGDWMEQIFLPDSLPTLLHRVQIGCIWQDYWEFMEENDIAIAFQANFDLLKTMYNDWKDTEFASMIEFYLRIFVDQQLDRWIRLPVIPYGCSDVTFHPSVIFLEQLAQIEGFHSRREDILHFISRYCRNVFEMSSFDQQWAKSEYILITMRQFPTK